MDVYHKVNLVAITWQIVRAVNSWRNDPGMVKIGFDLPFHARNAQIKSY